jgi:hypothetical protein
MLRLSCVPMFYSPQQNSLRSLLTSENQFLCTNSRLPSTFKTPKEESFDIDDFLPVHHSLEIASAFLSRSGANLNCSQRPLANREPQGRKVKSALTLIVQNLSIWQCSYVGRLDDTLEAQTAKFLPG